MPATVISSRCHYVGQPRLCTSGPFSAHTPHVGISSLIGHVKLLQLFEEVFFGTARSVYLETLEERRQWYMLVQGKSLPAVASFENSQHVLWHAINHHITGSVMLGHTSATRSWYTVYHTIFDPAYDKCVASDRLFPLPVPCSDGMLLLRDTPSCSSCHAHTTSAENAP